MSHSASTTANIPQNLRSPSSRRISVARMGGWVAAILLSCGISSHAQIEQALLTAPELFTHTDIEPSIAGSGQLDSAAANLQSTIPVIVLHNPVHLRGPLWHTADVEGGQTSIRPAMPFEKCHCYSADGGNGAFSFHLTDHLGLAAEGSRIAAGSPDRPVNLTSYLVGPQASALIGHHFLPFGHVLVGKIDVDGQTTLGRTFSSSSVAMGWGGGVDVVLNRDTSLRLAQVDSFVNVLPHSANLRQSDLRLTFGVVFRFGR